MHCIFCCFYFLGFAATSKQILLLTQMTSKTPWQKYLFGRFRIRLLVGEMLDLVPFCSSTLIHKYLVVVVVGIGHKMTTEFVGLLETFLMRVRVLESLLAVGFKRLAAFLKVFCFGI